MVQWWRGKRGEWYVVGQVLLGLLVVLGPRRWPGGPGLMLGRAAFWGGLALLAAGAALAILAGAKVGRHLTPLPEPVEGAQLRETGPYCLVRHPMYCGVSLMGFGWALVVEGPLTLVYALVLFAFFDRKSRREEVFLRQAFPGYEEYARRVRRLVPFVY